MSGLTLKHDEYNNATVLQSSSNLCVHCRRECEFEDDCDSLAWEETEETLLLWEDFPGCTLPPDPTHPPGEVGCGRTTSSMTSLSVGLKEWTLALIQGMNNT